ncbi:discoidin domain-containing protein [Bacteroides sp. 519]|uniref:BACON domain-containing protein n=1 Tax=Bacteroides sp. 519 TaxID=2302937 RepID=UPI0013D8CEA0|nr:discoidin domain-containing protein [Bacteroides sp. 519]NDV57599.1 hypothetical protein [Bacteroides sp. 519]
MKKIIYLILLAVIAVSCKDEDVLVPTALFIEDNPVELQANGETKTLEVKTTASSLVLENTDATWCTVTLSGNTLTVEVAKNNSLAGRETSINLVAPDRSLTLPIKQAGQPTKAVEVLSGWASSFQPNNASEGDIKYSFDGNAGTMYHSKWGETQETYELIYYLKGAPKLAMISYYPRSNMGNGTFGKIEILASTTSDPDNFTKIMDATCIQTTPYTPTHIELTTFVENTHAVKIIVDGSTSKGGFASCTEMEFYAVD